MGKQYLYADNTPQEEILTEEELRDLFPERIANMVVGAEVGTFFDFDSITLMVLVAL